ncbi:MAG: hypothetical protein PHS31_03630 [Victivallaceae bacterium]|nr:hypothetical protein [Victivallaceae bacterium]MDD4181342.1 hypothetical protein [Victivallaceae bacterium]
MRGFRWGSGVLAGMLTLGSAVAYDFEYDAGDIEGTRTSTGITYTLSVSKGNLGTSYDFDTKAGATSGSPSGIDISVSSGGATGTKEYSNDALPTANFTISMNGKLIPPSGGTGPQPTWGASGNAKAPYLIKSNQDGGDKEIVVKAGTSVTYTAYEGTSSKSSNWTVNNQTKNNESSIIFSRSWWDVPGWFSASMGTPDPGIYNITASPTDNNAKSDSGKMTVIGVSSISGGGKTSNKNSDSELTNSETIWIDSTASNSVALTAAIDPSGATWPSETPEWDASCGFWCLLGDHFIGNTTGQITVEVDTSSPDVITVNAQCGSSKKYIKIIAYEVDFDVSKNDLILKHDNESVFTVTAEPSSVFSGNSAPIVQIKRTGIGATGWLDLLSDTGEIDWTARVAGIFKLRLKTLINEADYTTPEKDMTVGFPTHAQIIADSVVGLRMSSEWQATLDDCTAVPNRYRERGFWVVLNTSTNKYEISNVSLGEWGTPPGGVSINLAARPGVNLSTPAANSSQGVKYAVSSFHTHPPLTYCPPNYSRATGPSNADINADIVDNVAGIVYDYTAAQIVSGHQKNDAAGTHRSRNQRSLTAE